MSLHVLAAYVERLGGENPENSTMADIIDFIFACGRLKVIVLWQFYMNKKKTIRRTGWLLSGLDDVESVADHSHRVALLAMLIQDDSVDKNK